MKLLEELEAYARTFSKGINHHYTRHTIQITVLTGAAATEIGGETTAREFGLLDRSFNAMNYIPKFEDTRLCIVDEISFMTYKNLQTLSEHLQEITECRERQFGKHPIVFLGDFCQLECIRGEPIYLHENSIFWEQALTCMVELQGTHRYNKCQEMKNIMPKMCEHGLTDVQRSVLNSRVIDGVNVKAPELLESRFATYHNKDRAEINARVFEEYLNRYHTDSSEDNIPKTAIVIRCDAKWTNANKKLTFAQRKTLFTRCSEAHCTDSLNRRAAPLLCLFSDCRLMGVENTDVNNGIANGTTSEFKRIEFKDGCAPKPMQLHGKWVYGIDIDEVDHLVCRWQDSRFEGEFKVEAKERTKLVRYPIEEYGLGKTRVATKMTMKVFPLILNHATTGHKLQGKSLDELVISEWSNVKNWAYVVLSRVRTLKGLFLTTPIPHEIDFSPSAHYLCMMNRLREQLLATEEDVAQLKEGVSL